MDRRIRRYIRAKQNLIKLLEEYKQVLIHRAVTGRIDVRTGKPYPAYKDSGVEWLGQVPEHWEVRRLKSATHLIMGQSPPSDDCSAEPIGLPFLQGCAEFGHVHPRAKQFCRRPVKVSPFGAILVSVRAPVGRLNVADQEYGIGRGLCAVVPVESLLDKTFVRYALSASVDGLAMSSTGSTYDAVSVSDVGSHCLPLPPLPEQTTIAAYLDAQTAKIDAAIAAARREVELLREYRERLIADVVTGKVDVREVAAQLPEEPPEDIEATAEEAEGEGEIDPAEIAESDIGGDADEV
jgi:type I restriction enzyme S subunit